MDLWPSLAAIRERELDLRVSSTNDDSTWPEIKTQDGRQAGNEMIVPRSPRYAFVPVRFGMCADWGRDPWSALGRVTCCGSLLESHIMGIARRSECVSTHSRKDSVSSVCCGARVLMLCQCLHVSQERAVVVTVACTGSPGRLDVASRKTRVPVPAIRLRNHP